ncbi:rga-1 [Pristionchus pacificus]|uniref:Rga-1 n=1 Tax=Pristionchus pacificus TaxID=54126 RepID=A0A2A6CYE4_PRIPA|nr:rga-1 [Pristionchus pacificus]|eukprot:PDM83244.1 rga-1 [Pristionchus pacificus]
MASDGDDFVEPEDGFADDDLLSPDDINVSLDGVHGGQQARSFLEREDFESELGSVDPFSEDFQDIAQHDIVEIIADGDRVGRPIIVFYAYRLPSNKSIDHDKLLRYLQATLDKVVDLDYTIIYFHYGLRSHNKPPVRWMVQAYKVLDRRYKKNLKALYVVHPTRFIRVIHTLFRPFISAKFEDKFYCVNSLTELEKALDLTRQLNVSLPVREHDATQRRASEVGKGSTTPPTPPRPSQQFDVTLEFILAHHTDHDVPPIVLDLCWFIDNYCLDIEGIFRKSANVGSIKRLREKINRGERVDFVNDAEYKDNVETAAHHAAVLLKTFLRSLGEPVTTNELYNKLTDLAEKPQVPKLEKWKFVRDFVALLPLPNYRLLKTVVCLLTKVAQNSQINLMNANNLSVVFGPNLAWPTDQQVNIAQLGNLNNFCYQLIVHYDEIFTR